MYPTNYFADASLILEQHYTNVDNSELMSAFGVFDFNVAETESNVVNFLTVSDNSNHVDYSTALFALGMFCATFSGHFSKGHFIVDR